MSLPFTLGAHAALSLEANLNSLQSGEMKVIGVFDLSSSGPFKDVEIGRIAATAATGTFAATDQLEIYVAYGDVVTELTDNIDSTVSTDQAAKLEDCVLCGVSPLVSAAISYVPGFSVGQKLGRSTMPKHVVILAKNASADATADLDATGNVAKGNTVAFA